MARPLYATLSQRRLALPPSRNTLQNMIRKQLKTFPEITRTQAGNCWIYTLQWVAKIPNPPRPTHVVPFDPNLHFAGRDNDNKCYSRTDIPVTAHSFKLAAEKPTN